MQRWKVELKFKTNEQLIKLTVRRKSFGRNKFMDASNIEDWHPLKSYSERRVVLLSSFQELYDLIKYQAFPDVISEHTRTLPTSCFCVIKLKRTENFRSHIDRISLIMEFRIIITCFGSRSEAIVMNSVEHYSVSSGEREKTRIKIMVKKCENMHRFVEFLFTSSGDISNLKLNHHTHESLSTRRIHFHLLRWTKVTGMATRQ